MKRKRQGYNDRLDESLGMRHKGPKGQSMKSRRHESEGMEERRERRKYAADKMMDRGMRMMHKGMRKRG